MPRSFVLSSICLWLIALPAFAARPPFTPQDLLALRDISDLEIAGDGSRVVYAERSATAANLWVVSSKGADPRS